eukprot:COSAG05_NODE_4428_length_1520_cov_13.282196_1_plen_172_part_00
MSASVLATGRAFSSQSAREISSRAGCRAGSPRARTHPTEIVARIQRGLRIQIVHALSQLAAVATMSGGAPSSPGSDTVQSPARNIPRTAADGSPGQDAWNLEDAAAELDEDAAAVRVFGPRDDSDDISTTSRGGQKQSSNFYSSNLSSSLRTELTKKKQRAPPAPPPRPPP